VRSVFVINCDDDGHVDEDYQRDRALINHVSMMSFWSDSEPEASCNSSALFCNLKCSYLTHGFTLRPHNCDLVPGLPHGFAFQLHPKMRRSSRLRGREDAAASEPESKRHKADDNAATQPANSEPWSAWDTFLRAKCFLNAPSDVFTVFELAFELRPERPCGEGALHNN
jgi:hypothetical protein